MFRYITNDKRKKEQGRGEVKIKVDFYADGFRSRVIEIPNNLWLYYDCEKRIYIAEKLAEHLPQDRNWTFGRNPQEFIRSDTDIIIITAKKIKDINECDMLGEK